LKIYAEIQFKIQTGPKFFITLTDFSIYAIRLERMVADHKSYWSHTFFFSARF